jgi:hypothetical protein
MKKLKFIMCLMISLMVTSCSNEEILNDQDNTQQESASALVCQLQALNDSLLSSKSNVARSFSWNSFARVCCVAGADFLGAYQGGKAGGEIGVMFGPHGAAVGAGVGGLICGVGASYGAYCGTRSSATIIAPQTVAAAYVAVYESDLCISDYYPSQISLKLPDGSADLQDIGAKHNLILNRLLAMDFDESASTSSLPKMERAVLESDDFVTQYYKCEEQLSKLDSASEFTSDGSVSDNVIKKYLTLLENYPEQVSDVEQISNDYIQLVANTSELTDSEKDILYRAICVAASSVEYWNEFYAKASISRGI